MSFSFEFTTKIEDAPGLVEKQYAPECVKDFVRVALTGLTGDFVYIKAYGHLYDGSSSNWSSADIQVRPVALTKAS